MSEQDRRRERREACTLEIEVFLRENGSGRAVSPPFPGVLTSISRHGAGIALREVMANRTHLVYGPQESAALQLVVVLPVGAGEDLPALAVRPVWFRKDPPADLPPFRLGVEFVDPLPPAIFREVNRRLHEKTVARTGYDAVINKNIE